MDEKYQSVFLALTAVSGRQGDEHNAKRETLNPVPNHEQRYRYSRADGSRDPGVSDRG